MLQDEDYDSDTSDEDFVPEGAESDDDPISGGEEEEEEDIDDDGDGDGGGKSADKKKKKKGKKKKDKKLNPLLAHIEEEEKTEEKETVEDTIKEEKEKKKDDNLWADFLADVEDKPSPPPKPKASSWAALLGKKSTSSNNAAPAKPATTSSKKEDRKTETKKDDKPGTVKITKVFEFAGEEVRIEKEVDANSVEAKAAALTNDTTETEDKKGSPASGVGGAKRPAGLAGIIGFLDNKKQKLSTLEKTKLDWNSFKSDEGIDEELESHKKSKHGYLDKQAFLERADLRQFEIERAMRQSKRSNR